MKGRKCRPQDHHVWGPYFDVPPWVKVLWFLWVDESLEEGGTWSRVLVSCPWVAKAVPDVLTTRTRLGLTVVRTERVVTMFHVPISEGSHAEESGWNRGP